MANVEGKATAITVVTPVRHGGRFLLAMVFFVGRHVTSTLEKLQQLSFIHYARWAVIRRFPDGGRASGSATPTCSSRATSTARGTSTSTRSPRSSPAHEGDLGHVVRLPGPLPVEPFKAYIRKNEYVANHYWSAYPAATTTEIISAQRVAQRARRLPQRVGRPRPDAFAAAYRSLLTDVQRDL